MRYRWGGGVVNDANGSGTGLTHSVGAAKILQLVAAPPYAGPFSRSDNTGDPGHERWMGSS